MKLARLKAIKQLEQTKSAIRRDGYNRGIRAAARFAKGKHWDVSEEILSLLKPPLENPNTTICGAQQLKQRRKI